MKERQKSKYPISVILKLSVHAFRLGLTLTDDNADQMYTSMKNFKRDCENAPLN